ncbi:MAG: P-II family nitrogen regulator [Chloroflexi bacterium]|jgi:nitrogen regulatory protein PII|nr:P-II family nitrogen regulator [Chloroflexota bacterium]
MKKIEAIIRVEKFEEVKEALKVSGYPGMTKITVEGHGRQKGLKQQFRGTTFEVEFPQKIKLEIVAQDGDVDGIVEAIVTHARTGEVGDGKIFIYPVESVIKVRTGERDGGAL